MSSGLTAVVSSNSDFTVGWLMKKKRAYVNVKLICEAQSVFKRNFKMY